MIADERHTNTHADAVGLQIEWLFGGDCVCVCLTGRAEKMAASGKMRWIVVCLLIAEALRSASMPQQGDWCKE